MIITNFDIIEMKQMLKIELKSIFKGNTALITKSLFLNKIIGKSLQTNLAI
jgi:hypothetical protein